MTPSITPHTQLCISIAQRPGRAGITLHNAGYRALGLDFVYKACAVVDLPGAIAGIRALGIRGAGVSMPFKEQVMGLLDVIDASAADVGAVNTIVNEAGVLTGYNTDVLAARAALQRVGFVKSERVLLLGAGGAARSFRSALAAAGAGDVYVSTRSMERTQAFVAGTNMKATAWEARHKVGAALLIQATPVGMMPEVQSSPLAQAELGGLRACIEIIASPPETLLLRWAREAGLVCSSGLDFSLDQAVGQFELYTGQTAPRQVMESALQGLSQ